MLTSFGTAEQTLDKVNRPPPEGEKIFANSANDQKITIQDL